MKARYEAMFMVHKNIDATQNRGQTKTSQHTAVITIEHLLDAAMRERGSIIAQILEKKSSTRSISPTQARPIKTQARKETNIEIILHDIVAKTIIKAVQISQQYSHWYVGTEHLLKAILVCAPKQFSEWMRKNNITVHNIEKNIQVILESTSKFPDITAIFRDEDIDIKTDKKNEILEYFGTELTSPKLQKNIDPVIGRNKEIERIINILCRRYKNNPLLLGEAGVGKTAIVEGLSKRISEGKVPSILANKKIYSIDMGSMLAGTMYRGEFEARLKQAIESAEKQGNIILFIDEIHNIMGAGSASGSMDAANMLKPALARGSLSIIGATTLDEYKKHIEQDSALERRLQPIRVLEPTLEETKEVLLGIKHNYETFHNVIISENAIDAAVALSDRYITEKLQPDKSIDLIDEASAKVKVEKSSSKAFSALRLLEAELNEVMDKKHLAVSKEKYSDAIVLKEKENQLLEQVKKAKVLAQDQDSSPVLVADKHIMELVSSLTKIPLGKIEYQEKEKLSYLEDQLKSVIIGQDKAIKDIANLIRRSRTSVSDPMRPIASFMFFGPSGVGKTETARQIAKAYFGDLSSLIQVDMSEFSESYSISKLIGAPAGYVGYRDSNSFTDRVRANPYSVVLLDEIEKAHKEVFNLLLHILENGSITDSTGRSVNFRNTIIIMTSNIGSEARSGSGEIGFQENGKTLVNNSNGNDAIKKLSQYFKTEFLNRIDSCVPFKTLSEDDYLAIIDQYLGILNIRLSEKNVRVSLSEKAKKHAIEKGHNSSQGARGVRKFFQDHVESEIAKQILNDIIESKPEILVDVQKGELKFS
ncbi:MAG: ATP-dependent Clp protease ATP-binding subunit ClpC [Parcubacteria group bacterium CG_4_9_14_0_2_um_filter_41_8]|nr:MAG: ATP-dependent Clp protease ATP-binding subunit ClpC [Parcubacteria group bacterium CG_4_9_14_0_2_um_filter_41_8]